MRLIDAGTVGALRSQALWHGIAAAMGPDDEPTLSLCRPGEAYMSLGYHRRLDELDQAACSREGLPILRRRIGGGPVLIDDQQLFFQITMPVRRAPASISRLYATLLEPAAAAFRALGLDARVDGLNDIAVGPRKISGTGAGQIGEAVVVVGNVIFDFDHARMARVLALPDPGMHDECLRLMRRHVSSLRDEGLAHVTAADAATALRDAYATALDGAVTSAEPTAAEVAEITRFEARLRDPAWQRGPDLPERAGRRVKVRSNVFVVHGEQDGVSVLASVVGDDIECATVAAPALNGTAAALERALVGNVVAPGALAARLAPFGECGGQILAAIGPGLEARW
ncbi:lipoate--protein ligase family protein [Paraconexibacter antarcticus]|uniref:Lipoate--protein ligase family protein n=1 Tax=Paraconexibacter antarcticus TaxID=2949664 RepID=A0ABY5DZB2_9ACTN|nr:biotin/lipoate A/B protein ligase family protein [Paraconexibacter antarcticus]UTI66880.1 lipoate--protein ligase family protein [Paraconexibacter antarcticus]